MQDPCHTSCDELIAALVTLGKRLGKVSTVPAPAHDMQNGGVERQERAELQERISRWLDPPLAGLGLASLALLVAEFVSDPNGPWVQRLAHLQTAVWVIFASAFALELSLAPSKSTFLRHNWISGVAVLVPPVRSLRLLRAARAARSLSLVRAVTAVNRATRALAQIAERGKLGYALALTVVVWLIGASSVLYFERLEPGTGVRTLSEAMGWSASLLADATPPAVAVSGEAVVTAILLRLYSLGAVGYLTATVAMHLIGVEQERSVARELRAVRLELQRVRDDLEDSRAQH